MQDRADLAIYAAPGVAVRGFPLQGDEEAGYLLYAYGHAIGVVEAKPEGFTRHGVEAQLALYARGLSPRHPRLPPAAAVPLREHCTVDWASLVA